MKITILSGIPGSGKSRWAGLEYETTGAKVVSADHYLPVNPTVADFGPAHAACYYDYLMLLKNAQDLKVHIIVDNTNLTAWELSPYVLAAQAHKVEPVIRRILPASIEECYKRQTHNVPFDTFCMMVANFKKRDVMPWWNVVEA